MAERSSDLIVQRPEGLYCPAGDFYIDPWRPVARAVICGLGVDGYPLAVQALARMRTA